MENEKLLRSIAQRIDEGESQSEIAKSLIASGVEADLAKRIVLLAQREYASNKDEYINIIIEDITKKLNNGESEDKVIDYLMSLGMSLENSRKTLTFIPLRKNLTIKIFKFLFWLTIFLCFVFLLLFIVFSSNDGSYTQKSFIFMGASAFSSFLTFKIMKKSYKSMMGKE